MLARLYHFPARGLAPGLNQKEAVEAEEVPDKVSLSLLVPKEPVLPAAPLLPLQQHQEAEEG